MFVGGSGLYPSSSKSDPFELSRNITIDLDKDKKASSHSSEPGSNHLLAR